MAEDALKIRRSAKTRFTRKKNEFFKAIAEKKVTEILKRKFDKLTDAWSSVEGKHDIYRVSQKFVPLLHKSVFQYDWTW